MLKLRILTIQYRCKYLHIVWQIFSMYIGAISLHIGERGYGV